MNLNEYKYCVSNRIAYAKSLQMSEKAYGELVLFQAQALNGTKH